MHLIGALLAAPHRSVPLTQSSAIIADMVWLLATSDDGLEHVRARTGSHHITLVLFLKGESVHAAEAAAGRLCERLVTSVPFLAEWRVHGCWSLDPHESRPPR
jgi:hypothetical protein